MNTQKLKNLQSYKFQTYLGSEKLTVEEKKLLFQLRTRSIPTKANYKNKYRFDLNCSLCKDKKFEENDAHLLSCSFVEGAFSAKTDLQKVKYDDIFEDLYKQIHFICNKSSLYLSPVLRRLNFGMQPN